MNPESKKVIVPCVRVTRYDLSAEERADMRVFYWAAYYGRTKTINLLILHRRWSPYIKSTDNQSIITSAIRGERSELVERLVTNFEYKGHDETT